MRAKSKLEVRIRSEARVCSEARVYSELCLNKTPAEAFTPPADEKQIDTNWTLVYYGSGRDGSQAFLYVDQNFLVSKWGGGLD